MNNQPRHSRARHAKPPSELSTRCDRVIAAAMREPNRRRLVALGTGTASLGLLAVAAVAGLSATGPDKAPKAATAAQHDKPPAATASPTASPIAAADPDEVPEAVTFFKVKDPEDKVAKHVKGVRRSGSFLRVYTDLREGDENSKPAISICEWTTEYLRTQAGDDQPIVFVHAKENDNGNVVLANKQSADDDCKVGETR